MSIPHWEHFAHDADIGIRGFGASLEIAFEQAALAMMAVITDLDTVRESQQIELSCQAPDTEILLVDWLNTLIFHMAVHKMIFSRFAVHIEADALTAWAWGETISVERHQPAVEIKGATYTALKVYQEENGQWIAQCVIDV